MYGELHSCSTCSSRMIWFRMAGLISRWISCNGVGRPGGLGEPENGEVRRGLMVLVPKGVHNSIQDSQATPHHIPWCAQEKGSHLHTQYFVHESTWHHHSQQSKGATATHQWVSTGAWRAPSTSQARTSHSMERTRLQHRLRCEENLGMCSVRKADTQGYTA